MTEIMIGNANPSWPIYRLGQLFRERREKVNDRDFPPLSVTKNGIVPQLETAAKSDDGDNRKGVRAGDFVINSRSDRKGSGGLSELDGSVSLINIVLEPLGIHPRFAHHLLRSTAFQEEFYRWGHGIVADLWTTRYTDMKSIRVALPDLETQKTIAEFLDRETALIDQLIDKRAKFASAVLDRRASRVASAILAEAPDLNIWPPKVPKNWIVQRAKFHFRESQARSKTGDEELLSVSHINGVTKRSEKDVYMFLAESNEGYKLVRIHDLVINTMWAWMGAMGISNEVGLISPSYGVYSPTTQDLLPEYMDLLVRSQPFIAEATRRSKGIHSSRLRLYPDAFLDMPLPIPPIEQQARTLGILKLSLSCENALLEKNADVELVLREYRSALVTSAVTGQIDIATWGKRGRTKKHLDEIDARPRWREARA